ncbi:MAG: hypothetical protein GY710_20970, partial [Desulfobacteraceae bacterium]|nr:hypothetical protein [Desulfobacteraceae bacterium]
MKKIIALTIVIFSFFFTNYLFAADQDGDVNKDYLTPQAYPWLYGGQGGSAFEAIDGWSRQIPGDKISSLTFYSNGTYLTGVKVDYLYGGSSSAGASTGTAITAKFDMDEYIWKGMIYQSEYHDDTDARISRIFLKTTNGNQYTFGENNAWKSGGGFFVGDEDNHYSSVVVGFRGNSSSVIDSISLIVATPLKLEFQGIEFDNNVTLGTAEQGFLADSVGINETPETQNMQLRMTYSEGGTSTDSWSNTNGVSSTMGVKMGVEAKAFGFQKVSAEWSYSTTNSYSETVGAT